MMENQYNNNNNMNYNQSPHMNNMNNNNQQSNFNNLPPLNNKRSIDNLNNNMNNINNINNMNNNNINNNDTNNLNNNNNFNPLYHNAPKYDIQGRLKKQNFIPGSDQRNILREKENIKVPWGNIRPEGQVATRTELNEKRKKEKIPDITYDLDGDGYVGGRDYVISKRFDVDKDGKLNQQEKRNALEAIRNNVEDEYIWNLENIATKQDRKDETKCNKYAKHEKRRNTKLKDSDIDLTVKAKINNHAHDNGNNKCDNNNNNNVESSMSKAGKESYLQPFRILQKRGKIIQAENFLPIRETYPDHPNSLHHPDINTQTELLNKRKKDTKEYIDEKNRLWEEHNPTQIIKEHSKISKHKPKHTSMRQIKQEKKQAARVDFGLDKCESDIKDVHHDPSLQYIYDPSVRTKGDLKEKYRQENIELSKQIVNRKHINEIERLNMREDEIFDMGYFVEDRKTLSKIKENRKKQNVDYNMKTFSKQTIGVHGHELPKFNDSEQYREFWKFREGWVENPKNISQAEYLEMLKFWKKAEELKINDYKEDYPAKDDFKKEYFPKDKKQDLIIKLNKLNHFKGFDPDNPVPIDIEEVKRNHIYRWTTLVNQFSKNKFKEGRYFDNLPVMKESVADDRGLFSSFADNGVFESKYGKEMFKKKNDEMAKVSEKEKQDINNANVNKYTLFQRFSSKDMPLNHNNNVNSNVNSNQIGSSMNLSPNMLNNVNANVNANANNGTNLNSNNNIIKSDHKIKSAMVIRTKGF